jgi:hypothetical protein
MNRILRRVIGSCRIRLVSLEGGTKHNAIPREASAVVVTDDPAAVRETALQMEAILKEVTATRDEAIKQNDDLKSELEDARHVNEYAVETARSKEKLIGEQRELMKKYGIVIDILIDKITALKKGERNG